MHVKCCSCLRPYRELASAGPCTRATELGKQPVLRSAGWWNLQLGWLGAEAEIRSAAVVVLFHAGRSVKGYEARQTKVRLELEPVRTVGKRAAGNKGAPEP